jgi:Leucine-rich repeat (LRR) protein
MPKSMGKLTDLKLLYLCDNNLTEIPKSIGKLKHIGVGVFKKEI